MTTTKQLLAIITILFVCNNLLAQSSIEKPKDIILLNNKIVTLADVEKYAKQGQLKAMHKGVSQSKRDSLYNIHGDIIGDREFITIIELLTKEEKAERDRTAPKKSKSAKKPKTEFLLAEGDKAANFVVNMINGMKISLSSLQGKVVLLNFWATWCAPCLKEFIEMPEKILEPYGDKNFAYVPIAIGQKEEVVAKKMGQMKKYGVEFNVGYDTQAKIWNQYAQGSIPKNFLIDKKGEIRFVLQGYSDKSLHKMAVEIEKLLAE